MVNPIAVAVPVFMVLIGLEWAVARWQRRPVYRLTDAITDLSCGVGQQSTAWLLKAASLGVYAWVWDRWRAIDLPDGVVTWVGTFVVVDFLYYLWHRFTHEVNLGWATHVVHHQSEDYNLAVALRQSLTSTLSTLPFYLPLAFLGVPPLVFATCVALNTLYQFWIHTETIRTTGPLEWVMNTPSHHRVHHAVNPRYLDKNYAGVFIVWDRLFGTFIPETEPCVYGTVKPLGSFNPLWANVAWFDQLARDTLAARTWSDRIGVWFRPPGWRPAGLPPLPGAAHARPSDQVKYDPPTSWGLKVYAVAWFVPVSVAMVALLVFEDTAPTSLLATVTALILATTVTWGGLFERRPWAVPAELLRLLAVATALVVWLGPMAVGGAAAMGIAGAAWVWRHRPEPVLAR